MYQFLSVLIAINQRFELRVLIAIWDGAGAGIYCGCSGERVACAACARGGALSWRARGAVPSHPGVHRRTTLPSILVSGLRLVIVTMACSGLCLHSSMVFMCNMYECDFLFGLFTPQIKDSMVLTVIRDSGAEG